jgi:PHS family inorganic phosphate transporter-like MFS transporter
LFATNAIQPILAIVLGIQNPARFGVLLNLAVLVTVPLGALIFGVALDLVGRRTMYGLGFPLLIAGIIGLAIVDTSHARLTDTISMILFWRSIMGLGIGGGYPLSAVIAAEYVLFFHCRLMLTRTGLLRHDNARPCCR